MKTVKLKASDIDIVFEPDPELIEKVTEGIERKEDFVGIDVAAFLKASAKEAKVKRRKNRS